LKFQIEVRFTKDLSPQARTAIIQNVVAVLLPADVHDDLKELAITVDGKEVLKRSFKEIN
jgi:hypothetical protein